MGAHHQAFVYAAHLSAVSVHRLLAIGHIGLWPGPVTQREFFYVAHDPDDFSRLFFQAINGDDLSDRILIGPDTMGHGFIDDHYPRTGLNILFRYIATLKQWDLHRAEIIWTDRVVRGFRPLIQRWNRTSRYCKGA